MKKELSEFLKAAYKAGRVKDVEEAFKEYPVENEWHKGKIENVINEEQIQYESHYSIGDIVFVKEYLYPDGKKGANHFFVIIDQDNIAVPLENFGMLISSNLKKLNFKANKLLLKDNKNNLDKNSIVKTDVIYKILQEQILFKVGVVDIDKVNMYKKSFYDILNKK